MEAKANTLLLFDIYLFSEHTECDRIHEVMVNQSLFACLHISFTMIKWRNLHSDTMLCFMLRIDKEIVKLQQNFKQKQPIIMISNT